MFKKLIAGDYSLPVTVWLFGFLGFAWGGAVVGGLIMFPLSFIHLPELGFLLTAAILASYALLLFVSVWRSAQKYRGWIGWAYLARFFAAVTAANCVGMFLMCGAMIIFDPSYFAPP